MSARHANPVRPRLQRAIRFLTERLGALQARREFKAFDELEATFNRLTAMDDAVHEDAILRLAVDQGFLVETAS
jgi:hypothetical protein